MTNINDLRKVTQSTVSSYESKVGIVTALMREVEQKIGEAYENQTGAIQKIRDTLAKSRNLRKRDFDMLMKPILNLQDHRKQQIRQLLKDFCREENKNISGLKKIMGMEDGTSLKDFLVLKKEMLSRPKATEAHLSELLKSFHQDQAELDVLLRRLLAKGDNIKLKDLKQAIRAFEADHFGDGVVVDDILREFSQVKDDIGHQWETVANTVGLRKYATQTTDD